MPRKRPARVRAELPRHPRRRRARNEITTVDGLSAAALAEIRRVEGRGRRLFPGDVGWAMRRWKRFAHQSDRSAWSRWEDGPSLDCPCCSELDPWTARAYLESAMRSMSRRRGRELRRLVAALDERC